MFFFLSLPYSAPFLSLLSSEIIFKECQTSFNQLVFDCLYHNTQFDSRYLQI